MSERPPLDGSTLWGPKTQVHIMGVINVTPDSFSDGGDFSDAARAVARAEELVADGASILDFGAESTRPGAPTVDAAEEWRRLEPVLKLLQKQNLAAQISVDTRKPALMLRAADLGATMINDVSGTADDATLAKLARYPGLSYLAMHMHGSDPKTMQKAPLRADLVAAAVTRFFAAAAQRLGAAGFGNERIWLDPGIGFGKTDAANVRAMALTSQWAERWQIAIGISRKSLIGRTLGITEPKERDGASKMLELGLVFSGARLVRTHDVRRLGTLVRLLQRDD